MEGMDNTKALEVMKKNMPELTPAIIKKYICETTTEQEVYFFIQLCKAQSLNPFLREAYLIKFGTAPATMVVGKETFTKRADRIPQYNGNKAGIILSSNQQIQYREGSFIQKGETLLGGWAEIFRKDRDHSTRIEVTLSEYEGKKANGEVNQQWKSKPATMIRKVALVQGLREAFPDEFASMYSEEEAVTAVPQQEHEDQRPALPNLKHPEVQAQPAAEEGQQQDAPEETPAGTTALGENQIISGVDSVTKTPFKKKDGSPGTKYAINAGEKYETFSETFAAEAKRAHDAGLTVFIEFTEDKWGKKIKDFKVQEPRTVGEEG